MGHKELDRIEQLRLSLFHFHLLNLNEDRKLAYVTHEALLLYFIFHLL